MREAGPRRVPLSPRPKPSRRSETVLRIPSSRRRRRAIPRSASNRRPPGAGSHTMLSLVRRLGLVLLGLILLASANARAEAPDQTPYLRVETGMHQAAVNR